jgi:hypothetical protein
MPERKSFLLRIDERVLDQVKRWADDDLRSLNAQIEFLLRETLQRSGRLEKPAQPQPGAPGLDQPRPDEN